MRVKTSRTPLDQHDIAVHHVVVPALGADGARILCFGVAAMRQQLPRSNDLCLDEPTLDVAVDAPGEARG